MTTMTKYEVISRYKVIVPKREKGVNLRKLTKKDLIHKLQMAEGNTQCYKGSFASHCGQTDCVWYKECVK